VHRYTAVQGREISGHVYRRLFAKRKPLLRDHVVIYRGLRERGLI
jgi:hypothetical protein